MPPCGRRLGWERSRPRRMVRHSPAPTGAADARPALLTSHPKIGVTVPSDDRLGGLLVGPCLPALILGHCIRLDCEGVGLAMLTATLPMLSCHRSEAIWWRDWVGDGSSRWHWADRTRRGCSRSVGTRGAGRSFLYIRWDDVDRVGGRTVPPAALRCGDRARTTEASGMASALTVIARQAGFALGVAMLGCLTPVGLEVVGFVWLFGSAATAAVGGVFACLLLLPRRAAGLEPDLDTMPCRGLIDCWS